MDKLTRIRIQYILLMILAVAGAAAVGAYFEIKCRDQIDLPEATGFIRTPLRVVEAVIWGIAALTILAILFVILRWHISALALTFNLYIAVIVIAIAAWTFYLNALRYEEQITSLKFRLPPSEYNDTAYLKGHEVELERKTRLLNLQYYKFIDRFQKDHHCCGLKNLTRWYSIDAQKFLHDQPCRRYNNTGQSSECSQVMADKFLLPASCCKNPHSVNCRTVKPGNGTQPDDLPHEKGCGKKLRNRLMKCSTYIPIPTVAAFVLTIYLNITLYCYVRQVNRKQCCTKCRHRRPKHRRSGVSSIVGSLKPSLSRKIRLRSMRKTDSGAEANENHDHANQHHAGSQNSGRSKT